MIKQLPALNQKTEPDFQISEFMAFLNTPQNRVYFKRLLGEFQQLTKKNPILDAISYDDILHWWKSLRDVRIAGKHGYMTDYDPATLNIKLYNLVRFFDLSKMRGFINFNPVRELMSAQQIRRIKVEKPPKQIKITQQMIDVLFETPTVRPEYKVLILIFMNSGLRISEVLSLKKTDFVLLTDKDALGTVRYYYQYGVYTKGSKYQFKRITVKAYDSIQSIIKNEYNEDQQRSSYFVCNLDGERTSRQNIDFGLKSIWNILFGTRDIAAHDFRRFKATEMYENGVDIAQIQAFLGHASIMTTMIYIGVKQKPECSESLPKTLNVVQEDDFSNEDIDALAEEFK